MSNLFEGLNDMLLLEEFEKAVKTPTEFKEVPFGTYEVKLHKITYKIAYDKLVYALSFKVVVGDYEGSYINFKKNFDNEFSKRSTYAFLKTLETDVVTPDKFKTEESKELLATEIKEATDGKIEYALEYGEEPSKNGKVYKYYKIAKVFKLK